MFTSFIKILFLIIFSINVQNAMQIQYLFHKINIKFLKTEKKHFNNFKECQI